MDLEHYLGRVEEREDVASPSLLRAMAATLDVPVPEASLPPLWHWALFQDWAPTNTLGSDGHPARRSFLPEAAAFPRRMWAGGRLSFARPVCLGQPLRRRSRIVKINEKAGSSGPLLWVSLMHEVEDGRGVALSEQQDLVYRAASGEASRIDPPKPAVMGAVHTEAVIDNVLLFRYSALTGNSHRIHYDLDYARRTEGYADLVVQGALQATLLAGFVQRQQPGGRLCEFAFKARRPALLNRCPLTLEAWPAASAWQLRSVDSDGTECMLAQARFAP